MRKIFIIFKLYHVWFVYTVDVVYNWNVWLQKSY